MKNPFDLLIFNYYFFAFINFSSVRKRSGNKTSTYVVKKPYCRALHEHHLYALE